MPTPSRTGTPSQVDASAGNGSTSVTVPAAATLVVAFWAHYNNDAGQSISSLTLNGVGFTIDHQDADGALGAGKNGQGVAYLKAPATGSQTFAWTWSAGGARAEGGEIVLVYVQDTDPTTPVGDSDSISQLIADNVTLTLTTSSTDFVLAFAESFNDGGPPVLTGTVFINDGAVNGHVYDVADVTAGSGTTAINMTGERYSSMAAIALVQSAGGGGGGGNPTFNFPLVVARRAA